MKATKAKAKAAPTQGAGHFVTGGTCNKCRRTGADLNTPCPGYVTAGELVTRAGPTPTTKKGSKRK
jgi:hypothetical protein